MDPIVNKLVDIYQKGHYNPSINLRGELEKLIYDISGRILPGSFGLWKCFERAYNEDREALRKAMIALLENGNSYSNEQISKYSSLKEVYEKKIFENQDLIKTINQLW